MAVEPLAKELGATKGSFYWHFADRQALVAATLELWERRDTDRVIAAIDESQDVETRLRNLLRLAFASVLDGSANGAGTVELALQASAGHPLVAPTLDRVTEESARGAHPALHRARAVAGSGTRPGPTGLHRVPRPRAGRARDTRAAAQGTRLRRTRRPGRRGAGERLTPRHPTASERASGMLCPCVCGVGHTSARRPTAPLSAPSTPRRSPHRPCERGSPRPVPSGRSGTCGTCSVRRRLQSPTPRAAWRGTARARTTRARSAAWWRPPSRRGARSPSAAGSFRARFRDARCGPRS